jgi:molecular chaperone GrpE
MAKSKKAINTEDMVPKADVEAVVNELTADIQRVQAEFVNYKRRAEEEKTRAVQYGKEQAVANLIPVIDNLERAIAHEPDDIKDHAWVKGIGAITKQLEEQLASFGLAKIGVVGELFDPVRHEAVAMDEGDGETEVVSVVLQTGYMLDGIVVRPAMVKVGKK